MASSMLTGDRRWAAARKSGMTVLGKVPKPINLPSQRSDNHGLDPNVEIVPKGTITWGSRPSSASPNAWGLSTLLSPNTDGSDCSLSRLNGRPSSGESGTRPSTAGSDRSHEPSTNVWTSNSRPSSASGVLQSNWTSVMSRPRSAETRPNSSQRSRFGEPIPENSVPWGHASSKANNFTLSSGDFPTLGSEKNLDVHAQQANLSSQGRPTSASGVMVEEKGRLEVSPSNEVGDVQSNKGNTNNWKRDCAGPSNVENLHGDPHMSQSCPSTSSPQHHINAWHSRPAHNPPDCGWYGGVPLGCPLRPISSPGNYPMEPFSSYSSQIPARPVPNPQSTLGTGAILGGYTHTNLGTFRPHMRSDSYMVPPTIIPSGPVVCSGPMIYDGYFGPPRPSLESCIPGMGTGPGNFNHYQSRNGPQEPHNFQAHSSGHIVPREGGYAHETHGCEDRFLLRKHSECVYDDSNEKRGHNFIGNNHHQGIINHQDAVSESVGRGAKHTKAEVEIVEGSSDAFVNEPEGHNQVISLVKLSETSGKAVAVDFGHSKSCDPEITPPDLHQHPTKKSTLLEKIEGLNKKDRISDGLNEGSFASKGGNIQRNKDKGIKGGCVKSYVVSVENVPMSVEETPTSVMSALHATSEISMKQNYPEDTNAKCVPQSTEVLHPVVGSSNSSVVCPEAHPSVQEKNHGMHGAVDARPKSKFNSSGGEERRKQLPENDSLLVNTMKSLEICSEVGQRSSLISQELCNQLGVNSKSRDDDEAHVSSDSKDYQTQRAKMKELATQRAKQLQKEEEERTREQKAKALAKLEELNKRSSIENSNKKVDNNFPSNEISQHRPDSGASPQPDAVVGESLGSGSTSDAVVHINSVNACKPRGKEVQTRVTGIIRDEGLIVVQAGDSGFCKPGGSTLVRTSDPCNNMPEGGPLSTSVSGSIKPGVGESLQVPTSDPGLNTSVIHIAKKCDSRNSNLDVGQEASQSVSLVTSCHSSLSNDSIAPSSFQKNGIQSCGVSKQRHTGNRRRHSYHQDQNSPMGTSVQECANGNTPDVEGLNTNSDEIDDISATKNKRTTWYKNKPDEAPCSSLPIPPILENIPETKPLESVSEFTVCTAQASHLGDQSSKDCSSQGWCKETDEGCGKAANQRNHNVHRRATKNIPSRPADKLRGGEAVWAPVKTLSKNEPAEVVVFNNLSESSNSSDGNDVQSNLKSKRAEIERYVSKLAAKELSRHGNSHEPLDIHQAPLVEVTLNPHNWSSLSSSDGWGSKDTKAEVGSVRKNLDHERSTKHGKSHKSWRQRSSHVEAILSGATVPLRKPVDDHQPSKFVTSISQPSHSTDGWNIGDTNVLQKEPVGVPFAEKVTSRGNRQGYKALKVAGSNDANSDAKTMLSGTTDKLVTQSLSLGSNDSHEKSSFKTEKRNAGEQSRSCWKPKSQPCTSSSHQEHSRNIALSVASQTGVGYKESLVQEMDDHQPQKVKDKSDLTHGAPFLEARNDHHQEARREKKLMNESSKDQHGLRNQEFSCVDEKETTEIGSNKAHDTNHMGGRGLVQDNGEPNISTTGEGARHGSHYGRHRAVFRNNAVDSSQVGVPVSEDPKDSFYHAGPSHRGRGQNHWRRGGGRFYVRNAGAFTQVGDVHGSK